MPRPCRKCLVRFNPRATMFKPAGIPARELESVSVSPAEMESIRLSDLEGLYHEQAAEAMGVSRPTFSRILERARRKVAEALVEGKALIIETAESQDSDVDVSAPSEAAGPARIGPAPEGA